MRAHPQQMGRARLAVPRHELSRLPAGNTQGHPPASHDLQPRRGEPARPEMQPLRAGTRQGQRLPFQPRAGQGGRLYRPGHNSARGTLAHQEHGAPAALPDTHGRRSQLAAF